jgi:hypothetical protein
MTCARRLVAVAGAVATVLLMGACADPAAPAVVTDDGLELTLRVAPGVVARHDSLLARLVIVNTTRDTASLRSACTSIAGVRLFQGGSHVSARGADGGCYPSLTTFRIPPGQVLLKEWSVATVDTDGSPIPPGRYAVRVEFHVLGLPDLEYALVVE